MKKRKAMTHDEHLKRSLERRVSRGDGPVPVVPVVKFACPNGCAERNIYTYGKRGRIGYHRCNECAQCFTSWEIPPSEAAKLLRMDPPSGHVG